MVAPGKSLQSLSGSGRFSNREHLRLLCCRWIQMEIIALVLRSLRNFGRYRVILDQTYSLEATFERYTRDGL